MYTSFLRNCYTRISQILIIIAMCDGLFLEIPIQVYLTNNYQSNLYASFLRKSVYKVTYITNTSYQSNV